MYRLEVTTLNSAGESFPATNSILLGDSPSAPYNLHTNGIIPNSQITLEWSVPLSSGGLPLVGYIVNKDGVNQSPISPTLTTIDDNISSEGKIGAVIKYKICALGKGNSDYSQELYFVVGSILHLI